MKKLLKRIAILSLFGTVFYFGAVGIIRPALAPTADIQILGASVSEQESIDNFVSFELPEETDLGVRAASFMVSDLESGQIISGKQLDSSLPVASLTKLMTVWTVLKHTDPEEIVTIPDTRFETTSPSLGLSVGDKVKVKDLVTSALVGSSNDAASVLAYYVSEKVDLPFGELMNQEANNLGMKNSRFSNPMGFDSAANYSSAKDLLILVQKLYERNIFDSTSRAQSYSFQSELGKNYQTSATNKLISQFENIFAIKTGFTNLALGSMINIVKTNDQNYLIIVIGSPDREGDTLKLRQEVMSR
ncbi:MAG TPA: serine hydrolase [Candidatus Doudnabacteria bacterium]|nr:serine hydrolase [Candidatus Doudnabacteria bacterium]